jgi:HK97 family phage major capsid protein
VPITIDELVRSAAARRREAEHALDSAKAALRRHVDATEASGAETPADVEKGNRLAAAMRAAQDGLQQAIGAADEVQRAAAEEAEVARRQAESYPVNVRGLPGGAPARPEWVREDGRPAALGPGQRFADHEVVAGVIARQDAAERATVDRYGSLGQMVRSMSTSTGSAIVPTVWSSDIIDRARNFAAVLQAGAQIVPMDAKVLQIGRLTTDPVSAFRAEGSTITATDPAFDYIQLSAKTLNALVVGSIEFFADAVNAEEVVSNAIAKSIALELDRQALFGGVVAGGETGATGFNTTFPTPPNPQGVLANLLANASTSVLGSGANGTAQTALSWWNEVLDTIYTPRDNNEAPNAMLWNSKLARQYAKAYDSQGRILTPPPDVDGLQKYITNQIPSFTQGTMTTRATDLFVGDWSQLLIGQRLDFQLQTLTERYAELGQIALVATWRGDVAITRPKAFAVYRYLQGA